MWRHMEYKWQTLNCHNLTPFLWVGFYNINVHTGDPTHDHLGNSTFILGQWTKIMGRVHSRIFHCWGHGITNGIWSDGKYDHLESRISIRIQMVWGEVWGITPHPYPVELLVRPLFSLLCKFSHHATWLFFWHSQQWFKMGLLGRSSLTPYRVQAKL